MWTATATLAAAGALGGGARGQLQPQDVPNGSAAVAELHSLPQLFLLLKALVVVRPTSCLRSSTSSSFPFPTRYRSLIIVNQFEISMCVINVLHLRIFVSVYILSKSSLPSTMDMLESLEWMCCDSVCDVCRGDDVDAPLVYCESCNLAVHADC